MAAVYDRIGVGYAGPRHAEPRWMARIGAALGDARRVVDVGAGAGSYEPRDRLVVAVDPSAVMIAQRPLGAAPAVRAAAEGLPFAAGEFDAALAVFTVHHWTDSARGLAELRRVARQQVVVTWDRTLIAGFWLVRDYLPVIADNERKLATLPDVVAALDVVSIEPLPVPADCCDSFLAAHWRRPEAYLDPAIQAANSAMALLGPSVVRPAMARLADDLDSGAWAERNAHLLDLDEMDLGYRLVVATS